MRLIIGFLLSVTAVQAQSAQFTGRVTDPSRASVPGVRITVRHLGNGVVSSALTNVEGYYTVTRLDPGPYQLDAAADG